MNLYTYIYIIIQSSYTKEFTVLDNKKKQGQKVVHKNVS